MSGTMTSTLILLLLFSLQGAVQSINVPTKHEFAAADIKKIHQSKDHPISNSLTKNKPFQLTAYANITTYDVTILGNFSSPNYPSYYSPPGDVLWKVVSPSSAIGISLQFLLLDIYTYYDYITVYDENLHVLTQWTGYYNPFNITFYKQTIYVRFEYSIGDPGFLALYSVPITNEEVVNQMRGSISNPGYPNGYNMYTDVVWILTAGGGCASHCIQLEFLFFNLNTNDFLLMYNGNGVVSTNYISYSGNTIPKLQQSIGSVLTLRFMTSTNSTKGGFLFNYYITGGQTTLAPMKNAKKYLQ